jgi:hypothetical protein
MAELTPFDPEDLNGAVYIAGSAGEQETEDANLICWVPELGGAPNGIALPFKDNIPAEDGAVRTRYQNWIQNVYSINCAALQFAGVPAADSKIIAYLRMLAIREGLGDPRTDPRAHHCKYNLVRSTNIAPRALVWPRNAYNAARARLNAAGNNNPTVQQTIDEIAHDANPPNAADVTLPPAATRQHLRANFVDIVCLVAYIFRTRGHHYKAAYNSKYEALYRGCVRSGEAVNPGTNWEYIARSFAKMFFPDTLDEFWFNAQKDGHCSGQLTKRFNSASAGTAVIHAVYNGVMDLLTVFPNLRGRLDRQIRVLLQARDAIILNRWAGCINRNMYNAPAVEYNEADFGALAATIIAALESFAPDAPLLRSPAVQRAANNAPISGAIILQLLQAVIKHPATVEQFIVPAEE